MSVFVGNSLLAFPHRMESIYFFKKMKILLTPKITFQLKFFTQKELRKISIFIELRGCVENHRISHFIHSVSHGASL